MTVQQTAVAGAWKRFLADRAANVAVSLAYNPHRTGTAGPCFRFTRDGECVALVGSGASAAPNVNLLPSVRRIPLNTVQRSLDVLHRTVDRTLFGTRFNKLPQEARSSFIGFVEQPDWNLHVHLAWQVPAERVDEFTEVVTDAWTATSPSASIRVKLIHDAAGWANYVTKQVQGTALNADADLFVASRSARS
ncbi:hypothetical protein GU700_08485 [Methylobacterium sp. NI91]|nr:MULTISPECIES: hypothetical protein [unclassified Methylobacterium]QIJ74611.1 hypothetical protein CLZ_08485 [Methylobacterium sp. CLZ]QIJ79516.1 hypothetical protein GU700_08485 [Methylobacterium sp. NI91]